VYILILLPHEIRHKNSGTVVISCPQFMAYFIINFSSDENTVFNNISGLMSTAKFWLPFIQLAKKILF